MYPKARQRLERTSPKVLPLQRTSSQKGLGTPIFAGAEEWALTLFSLSGCRKRSAAKGVRSLFSVFGTLSVTFSDACVTFFVTFLPDFFCRTPFAAGWLSIFGHPEDIPAKIPGYPAQKFGFPGFPGTCQTFWPPLLRVENPTPPEDIRTQNFVSVAPPAEPRGEKKLFFCANFGRWKTFKIWWKMGGEKFLVGLRGAQIFSIAFRIVFRILFRVFQTVFRIDLNIFRGQIRSARYPDPKLWVCAPHFRMANPLFQEGPERHRNAARHKLATRQSLPLDYPNGAHTRGIAKTRPFANCICKNRHLLRK